VVPGNDSLDADDAFGLVLAELQKNAERERLLGQAQKVFTKGAASGVDIASAIGTAVRRRPTRTAVDADT